MVLTLSFLYKKFDQFNNEFFNNELPKITIDINKTKTTFGCFQSRNIRGKKIPVRITISKYYEQTEIEYCNTLIHEMIHYYICVKNLAPWYEDPHGKTFQKMMNEINAKSQYNIGIVKNLENRVLSNKNKEFRLLRYRYKEKEYFCRVSPTITLRKAEEKFSHIKGVEFLKVYSTKNPKVDVMKLYIKKLGMFPFEDKWVNELNFEEVA